MTKTRLRIVLSLVGVAIVALSILGILLLQEVRDLSSQADGAMSAYLDCSSGHCSSGYSVTTKALADGSVVHSLALLTSQDLRTYSAIIEELHIDLPRGVVQFSHAKECLDKVESDPVALKSVRFEPPREAGSGGGDAPNSAPVVQSCGFWLSVLGEDRLDKAFFHLERISIALFGGVGLL